MTTTYLIPTPRQVRANRRIGWYRTYDLDEVAVLRAVGGDHLKLTKAERDAAIDQLDRRGLSAAQVARKIGCSQRTVVRRRAARMAAGGPAPASMFQLQHSTLAQDRIAALDAAGIPVIQIAMRLGVNRQTVYNHRARRTRRAAISGQVAA